MRKILKKLFTFMFIENIEKSRKKAKKTEERKPFSIKGLTEIEHHHI